LDKDKNLAASLSGALSYNNRYRTLGNIPDGYS